MRGKNTSILVIAAVLLALTPSANAYREVIDLGTLSGYSYSYAYSINDNGQIVGIASKESGGSDSHAVLFDPTGNGNNIDLGTLGGTLSQSTAYSINNAGQIVGWVSDVSGYSSAVLFDSTGSGANINLGEGLACSINDNGLIVGRSFGNGAAIFKPTGGVDKILGNDTTSLALSVNNSGQIVGGDLFDSRGYFATIFDATSVEDNIDLGTLVGNYSYAYSINDLGKIVGCAIYDLPREHKHRSAVLFDSLGGGDNIDLGTLAGYSSSMAFSINDIGQIVGYTHVGAYPKRAVLFDPTGNGNNVGLNTLIDPSSGWILEEAHSINNSGWIVGSGNHKGQIRAFLLIPEPASALLFALGGLAFLRKRKPALSIHQKP